MATTTDVLKTRIEVTGHQQAVAALSSVAGVAGRLAGAGVLGAAALAGVVTGIGVAAVKAAASFEQLQIKLNVLYGSASAGARAFAWAKQFEKWAPIGLEDTVRLMAQMKAMGLNPETQLRSISDLALGDLGQMERIVSILGVMKTKGFVSGDELLRLHEAAVPAAKILGITAEQLNNVATLRLPADSAIAKILDWANKNRGGATEKQSQTLIGVISTLQSAWKVLLATIGAVLAPEVKEAAKYLTKLLESDKVVNFGVKVAAFLAAMFQTLREDGFMMVSELGRWLKDAFSLEGHFKNLWIEFRALGMEAVAAIIRPFARPVADMLTTGARSARDQKTAGTSLNPWPFMVAGSNMMTRYDDYYARFKQRATGANVGAEPGAVPTTPGAGAGNPIASGVQAAIERIILGGGSRAQRAARTFDYLGRSTANAPVTVQLTAKDGGKLDRAYADIVTDIINRVLTNRQVLRQLKAGLESV